jgi:hypothetical protein
MLYIGTYCVVLGIVFKVKITLVQQVSPWSSSTGLNRCREPQITIKISWTMWNDYHSIRWMNTSKTDTIAVPNITIRTPTTDRDLTQRRVSGRLLVDTSQTIIKCLPHVR